jgi:predicted HAD superfamily Cof-like phosphohydrolase
MAGYDTQSLPEVVTTVGKSTATALNTSASDTAIPRVTNFECVTEDFMKNFGQKVFQTPQMDIFDRDPKTVTLRYKLIEEEVNELAAAIKEKDMVETVDALGDILYVVYGAGGAFGINLDKAFDLIHKSNMTKLCVNEEEAKETVKWYQEHYTGPEGKYPMIRLPTG